MVQQCIFFFCIHNGVCKLQRLLLREGQNMKASRCALLRPTPGSAANRSNEIFKCVREK